MNCSLALSRLALASVGNSQRWSPWRAARPGFQNTSTPSAAAHRLAVAHRLAAIPLAAALLHTQLHERSNWLSVCAHGSLQAPNNPHTTKSSFSQKGKAGGWRSCSRNCLASPPPSSSRKHALGRLGCIWSRQQTENDGDQERR